MAESITLSLEAAQALVEAVFVANHVRAETARSVAQALVAAHSDGQVGHGLSRVPSYILHARCGKVDGQAVPTLHEHSAVALSVDAHLGFAYPAIDLALEALAARAKQYGIGVATLVRSHHFGQAGQPVEQLAAQGLIGLMLGNTPQAMAFWGGTKPSLGTNPLAFACPLPDNAPPLVIDLALTQVARGKIVAAAAAGETLAAGLALDSAGQPTCDAAAALKGTLLPIGGAKGAALALMVEILAAALTGGHFGFEASSFFDDQGGPPNMGQVILALDPERLSQGQFLPRMATLLAVMAEEEGVRLPGSSRLAKRAHAKAHGITLSAALYQEILTLKAPSHG
jgi:(2R)-3-sulfolactate dehydrogenase (NADP+)